MTDEIRLETYDSIATLTLNRPKALNALNRAMAEALDRSLREVEGMSSLRCLVIRGAGDHFMAGGDIRYFQQCLQLPEQQREAEVNSVIQLVNGAAAALRRLPQPVIASIRGNAAGFGMSLVAACDLAIAADNARFTQAYSQIATTPDGGNTFFLPRVVGLKRAAALCLLNQPLDAGAALEQGLINNVVANDELEAETDKMARRITRGSMQAMAGVKALLNASLQHTLEQQLQLEQASFVRCALGADFREGLDAFVGKRQPRFA